MEKDIITYKPANPSDKNQILQLFKAAFAQSEVKEKNPDLWDYQMLQNPDGEPFMGTALCDNKMVGYYTVIPYNYINEKGQIVKVGLVIDVMTHPDYQGRKIFVNLGKYTLLEAKKKINFDFTIGYPFTGTTHDMVIPGHKKVGWKLMDRLIFYMLPIKTFKIITYEFPSLRFFSKIGGFFLNLLLTLNHKLKAFKFKSFEKNNQYSVVIKENIQFTSSDLALIEIYSQNKFIKIRNQGFLEWRFIKKPDAKYILIKIVDSQKATKALCILRFFNLKVIKLGVIIDIIADKDYFFGIFKAGIGYCKSNECDGIIMLDYLKSDLSSARDSFSFLNTREYYQIINWSGDINYPYPIKPRLNFTDFDIF